MRLSRLDKSWLLVGLAVTLLVVFAAWTTSQAQDAAKPKDEAAKPDDFAATMAKMTAAKPDIEKKHASLLAKRYDLANKAAKGATMSGGKAVQQARACRSTGSRSAARC